MINNELKQMKVLFLSLMTYKKLDDYCKQTKIFFFSIGTFQNRAGTTLLLFSIKSVIMSVGIWTLVSVQATN